jgi:protoheme IX farnesyltransferase
MTAGRARAFGRRLGDWWWLTKGPQSLLLLVTGLAGYASAGGGGLYGALAGSLLLAIAGSTVLNMVHDRDLDARMRRTAGRPLVTGRVRPGAALAVGIAATGAGVGWALGLHLLYGLIVLGGVLFDVGVYTLWLKRRTPMSILWGGVAGAMPVLAGRALGVGQVELVGVLLALSVLLWIPTHILTFSLKYAADYRAAGVPVLPNVRGERYTRVVVGVSTALAAVTMTTATALVGTHAGALVLVALAGLGLAGMAAMAVVRSAPRLDRTLYKLASVYMLAAMAALAIGG